MARFKVVVQQPRKDGYYTVYIRLTHNRKICYIKTDKQVGAKGIVTGTKEVKDTFVLGQLMPLINGWIDKLKREETKKWSIEDVRTFILMDDDDICFSTFARKYIDGLYETLEHDSAYLYELSLKSLQKYAGTDKIMFSDLTTHFLENWIASLSGTKAAKFAYPTFVKKIFKEGQKEYNDYDNDIILIKNNPWIRVKIPKPDRAKKRAITMEQCRAFFAIVPRNSSSQLVQDICKLVFCLAGINVADLYYMKKESYYDGILHYERKKTRGRREDNAYIEMKVPDMLLPTVERYLSDKEDSYLFNFHKRRNMDALNAIMRDRLIEMCQQCLNIPKEKHYTAYTFRHSWATIAQNDLGASYEEIGFALNHISSHKVTMGYVKPDFSRAWELNEKVVQKVFFTNDKSKRLEEHHLPVFDKVDETFELSADAYFMGEVVAHVDGKGYKNTDEIIEQLMDNINDTVPKNCTIQIKVKNITKDQTKYFERIRAEK